MAIVAQVSRSSSPSPRGGGRACPGTLVLLAALVCGLPTGCVTLGTPGWLGSPKKSTPCQVTVSWQNEIRFAPDTTRGGELTPGLAGRVYLFGPDVGCPLEGDGSLYVELADASEMPPKALEEWRLPADKLQLFLRKDPVGVGYTVFLPWSTYRPDLTKVRLKLAYQPKEGATLFAAPALVAFDHDGMPGLGLSRSLKTNTPPSPPPPVPPVGLAGR